MWLKHVKTIINHPMFDGLYHTFMVILGMVYYCFNHISFIGTLWKSNIGSWKIPELNGGL